MSQIENNEGTISDDIGFRFNGSDKVGVRGFECKMDDKNWQSSTVKYQPNEAGCYYMNLEQGLHTFQARTADTSGNKDPTPLMFSWTIVSLRDAIGELRDFTLLLDVPSNIQQGLINSLDNSMDNIKDDNSYDHLICEYIDSFSYRFSRVMVTDFITENVANTIITSSAAIRDRTGCNSPVVDTVYEPTVNEGASNIVLDGSGSFDSKDDKSVTYQWAQISGLPVSIKDGNKPKASFNAPLLDGTNNQQALTFRLTVTDRNELSSEKTVQVIVNKVNAPPVAESQSVTTTANIPVDITLMATYQDGDALTYAIASEPKSGEISGFDRSMGALIYTPNEGFTGKDSFAFKASDGTQDSNTAQVAVTVIKSQDSTRENSFDTKLQNTPGTSENNTRDDD